MRRGVISRTAVAAGIVGPVVFMVAFTINGWTRPGYHVASMFVSELSIGPGGYVQRANFVVCGLLILVFSTAIPYALRGGRARGVLTKAVGLLGVCLAASGFFNTDPSAMFTQTTWPGRVHGILGAVVFTCMPITAFAAARCLRHNVGSIMFHRWSTVAGVCLVVLVALLKLSELRSGPLFAWRGLVQRADLMLYLSWMTTLAVHIARRDPGGTLAASAGNTAEGVVTR